MNYVAVFKKSVRMHADCVALVDSEGERRTTYAELDMLSGRVAGKLRKSGVHHGDFVLINIDRCTEYLAAYLGVLKAGGVVVPVTPEYPQERIDYVRRDCAAVETITLPFFENIGDFEPLEDPVDNAAAGLLIYTSGSTGSPKGILLSTADLARSVTRHAVLFQTKAALVFAASSPLSFGAHIIEYLSVLALGGEIHMLSDAVRKSATAMVEYYQKHGITAGWIVPQMLRVFMNVQHGAWKLEIILSGGERLSNVALDDVRVFNVYGMTEAAALVTHFEIDRAYENTPIGKALEPLEVTVCAEDGCLLKAGEEGEICIKGDFDVIYFHDDERTARTMCKTQDGKTVIHSGDIGRLDENGNIVFVNRRDWMVKVNGQRVETLEIETLLQKMPEVANAAVKPFVDVDGQTYLTAYYALSSSVSQEELHSRLLEKLPAYMIPRFFVQMEELPRNINGKLDRNALLPPDAQRYKVAYIAPQTDAQRFLCDSFEAVLHCGRVGIHDDFFALGGDSIKVLKLVEATALANLSPDKVLEGKTPQAIAALCGLPHDGMTLNAGEIPPVCPLTEAQRGVYLECVNDPESVMYNIPMLCVLPPDTDPVRFSQAVSQVVQCHRALQVAVRTPDGVPSMVLCNRETVITEKTVDDLACECRAFVRPFDLENGPLYRLELCRYPAGLAFLFDVHHLVFDGTSAKTLVSQIADVYNGGNVPQESLTVFDISAAESRMRDTAAYRDAQEFFRNKFDSVDCDGKPIPDQVDAQPRTGAGRIVVDIAEQFSVQDVVSFTKAHKISENTLFLGAFAYALAKFNGMSESAFCTVNNGRHDPRLSDAVGMFVKTLPLYYSIDESMPVSTFLPQVQDDFYRTMCHDCISFGELAASYGVNTDVVFVYQAELFNGATLQNGKIEVDYLETGDAQSDLDVMLMKTDSGYRLMAHFRHAQYSEALIRRFANLYLNVIKSMLTADTLGDITLLDVQERAAIDRINQTGASYNDSVTVVDLFRAQVKKSPDAVGLVCRDKRYTYREIDEITDILAQHLVKAGVGREKIVGVLIPRSEYIVICSLGVLKAGGAYLPLDPSYPPERLNLMMQDSGAMMLIADPKLNGIITDDFTGLRMSTEDIFSLEPGDVHLAPPRPEDLFVMLYTSGSTGTPKGVMFEHANTLVTTEWVKKYFDISESSHLTQYASYGFDAHAFDIYPAITAGAQLHIITDDIRLDFLALRRYYNKNGITHTVMTTQIGRQFALMGGLTTLQHLSVAGEKLTPLDVPDDFAMYNLYGPTEGSIITSAFRIDRRYKDVPIGKAVDNLKMYVVDKNGKLLPVGGVGELWIAGPHVTRGYRNRPEKTAEAYGKNPFDTEVGYERIYRTGDIVRLLDDGNLQFVGRRDAQVKVRGFRVELTEIEEVIRRFEGIKDATVAAFDEPSGGKYVAAYVVSDAPVSAEALSAFIREEKPPYMVPAVIMQIDAIPLNQNQKVNKRALPIPQRHVGEIVAPQTDEQQKIWDIVAEVIGHKDFGIDTNLYDAGLTSIGSVKLNVELAQAFDVPIRIADLKTSDTVRKLEKFLAVAAPSQSYDIQSDYPITQSQIGIFIECVAAPNTTIYNIPVLVKLGDGVELPRLKTAIEKAIHAHAYVKTTLFTDRGGNVRAKRNDTLPVAVSVIRCDALPEESALVRPFALLEEPLYRIAIYTTADGNYLFMDFHHIICDGTSEGILMRAISTAYAGEELTVESFTGYEAALEEQAVRESAQYEEAVSYWKGVLSGCDTNCLPKKEPESSDGGAGSVNYAGTAAAPIKDFCAAHGLSLNSFFNACFAFVLSRFSGKDSLTYTTVYNGRNDSRLAESVTLLVKTLPMVAQLTDDMTVTDFVRQMQTQIVDGMANDACSFAELSNQYGVKADLMLVYQGDDMRFDRLCGEEMQMQTLSSDAAKAPISVSVFLSGDTFEYTVEYRPDMYSAPFARALADALSAAAVSFTQCTHLKEVSMLSDTGEALYRQLNDSYVTAENICCHQMFERLAAVQPDAPAVIAAGETLTYGELNSSANRMARALIRLGVGRDSIIGLVLDRTKEVLITELAIMKAGGAFLPMIPTYPDERIHYCLTNAESPYVITTTAIKDTKAELFAEEKPYRTLITEELLAGEESADPALDIAPEQLAYCIYTSGSTGTPKGVMIEHHSFSNFVQTNRLLLDYYRRDDLTGVALASSSISFDMSLYELMIPICSGKCVYICSEEEFHNPLALKDVMVRYNAQMMVCTPSFMNNMVSMPEFSQAIRNLRSIVVGAEAFPSALYDTLRQIAPDLQIVNGYGPTECTVCCSTKELSSGFGITIGRPTGNMKFYIVDRFGNILPPYAVGEMIICGDGVGRGYVKLPEKTAAMFFSLRGLPAYHSGDSVRLNGNAEIDFGGRIDNQVKLRGFRIELDEIEKVMCAFDSVKQSKVLVRNNGSEDYLVGFYTADAPVDPDALTAYMKSRLTYYMVPAIMMQLDQMPLTPNGKIDKNGFPEVKKQSGSKSGRRAPKKSLEQRLCEVFGNVLGLDEVFADDNFFELGGTSLSASKVTMVLMSQDIEVKYGDIFDNPTPEALAGFIEGRGAAQPDALVLSAGNDTVREALKWNAVKYAHEVTREKLGNVLLTGAVGFLGIHVLNELLQTEDGHIWCLVRKGNHESAEIRLKAMLIYYFSDGFDEALRDRITVVDADITDAKLAEALADIPFDTVINCAACVKHFSDTDILEQINVHGVENLIEVCLKRQKKLIQVSTVSVPGIHTAESYEKQIRMHENELFVIDDMANKYAISKYTAELRMLDAIEHGLRGKIVRVGNLMGRHSDGEFQVNMETNMFMSGIRGFSVMGKYPISHMTDPMRFSPVDCTARAVVLLAGTNDKFTAFNADNRYGFDEMKIIDACNRNGITILPAADEEYYAEFQKKLGDDGVNARLNGLAAYDIKDAHAVDTDNLFTTNILYRIGFSWPLVDDAYLDRAIHSIMTLDYFNVDEDDGELPV